MDSLIESCLQQAVSENMTTVAFPALGCGKLKYQFSDVAECFMRAEQLYRQKLKVKAFC